jgi:hypothetical protein
MNDASTQLSREEYLSLSEQKAEDWRSISSVNPTMFGAAGALLAAGVSQNEAIVVALSPLPLFLSVWHMVRHARLQLQMITYLAVFAGEEHYSWERDLAIVRPRYWAKYRRPHVVAWVPLSNRLEGVAAWLVAPAAWNTWLLISLAVAIPVELIPVLGDDYSDTGLALALGVVSLGLVAALVIKGSRRIETERTQWTALWERHRDEPGG